MAKRRIHQIAKDYGLTSKELLSRLQAAGLEVTTVSSSVDLQAAQKALKQPSEKRERPGSKQAAAQRAREQDRKSPKPPSKEGGRGGGGRRRVVIDPQASRRGGDGA